MPRKKKTLCRVCGKEIHTPAPGQKYHLGACRETAKKLLNIKYKLKESTRIIDDVLNI